MSNACGGKPVADAPDAGYPSDWERRAETVDGVEYRIRPIRSEDAQRERAFILGLSPQSRYGRMMYEMRDPTPALIDRFVKVDYRHDMAFVALARGANDERIVGVARYAADGSGTDAEFAVVVADDWQSRGVGTALIRILFEFARARAFRRLHGSILASNERMVNFVRVQGMTVRRSADDSTLLEASLDL